MPRRLPSTLVLAASAAAALALPATTTARPQTASGAAAPSCHNLTVDAGLRRALTRAHARPREGAISRGSIYYGRCGQTRYAIAGFSKAGGDQPEKFRRQPGKPWRDFGDGFEDGCSNARYPIPRALVLIWGFCQR